MLTAKRQQLYVLWHKDGLLKGKKTSDICKKLKARVTTLATKTDNSSNESVFADEKHKANNRNNPALDRKGSGTRQSQLDS